MITVIKYKLNVGESTYLEFSHTPWTSYPGFNSSDSNIVSVDSGGKITAISPYIATITGKYGFSADYKVTVSVYVTEPEFTGDIDGNGQISVFDLLILQQYLVNDKKLTAEQ